MNHGLRLETLKRLDEEGCKYLHRADYEYRGGKYPGYVLEHLDDRYVLFCGLSGAIIEYGDQQNTFPHWGKKQNNEDCQWAFDFLFARAKK